jgi:hypothetical protein
MAIARLAMTLPSCCKRLHLTHKEAPCGPWAVVRVNGGHRGHHDRGAELVVGQIHPINLAKTNTAHGGDGLRGRGASQAGLGCVGSCLGHSIRGVKVSQRDQSHKWVNKDVRVPEGAYLASSHETPGAERALLFDRESGNNLGPAEVRDSARLSDEEIRQLMAICLAVGAAVGSAVTFVVAKGPDIKRGWNEKVLPAAKAKWNGVWSRGADSHMAGTGDEPANEPGQQISARPRLTLVNPEADKPSSGSAAPAA